MYDLAKTQAQSVDMDDWSARELFEVFIEKNKASKPNVLQRLSENDLNTLFSLVLESDEWFITDEFLEPLFSQNINLYKKCRFLKYSDYWNSQTEDFLFSRAVFHRVTLAAGFHFAFRIEVLKAGIFDSGQFSEALYL